MGATADPDVTRLIAELSDVDRTAGLAEGLPVVYEELRRLAGAMLADERGGHTLQATALVHEAYLRLANRHRWESRGQYRRTAARVMRHLLIDHARVKKAAKRGGGQRPVALAAAAAAEIGATADDLVSLDDAMRRLETLDGQKARVVELRFFAGCTIQETAEALGISTATVEREWRFARAWLRRRLEEDS